LRKKKKERQSEMKKIGSASVFLFLSFFLMLYAEVALGAAQVSADVDRHQLGIGEAVALSLADHAA